MTNYITAQDFTDITGVTADQCGEVSGATEIRDNAITKAQVEVLREVDKTSYASTETEYELVKEAIAWLAAHKISMRNQPLSITGLQHSPFKEEYKRVIILIKKGENTTGPTLPTDGGFDVVTTESVDEDYNW